MRQVADGGISRVMCIGRHFADIRSQGSPKLARQHELGGGCFWQRREDDFLACVQAGLRVSHTRQLFTANRMRRHKTGQQGAQAVSCGQHHVAFGRPHIHHQRVFVDDLGNGLQRALRRAHRHGQQHQVGALGSQRRRGRYLVNHAHLQGYGRAGGGGAKASHAFNQTGALKCQGKRAAHEAAANQAKLFEHLSLRLNHLRGSYPAL